MHRHTSDGGLRRSMMRLDALEKRSRRFRFFGLFFGIIGVTVVFFFGFQAIRTTTVDCTSDGGSCSQAQEDYGQSLLGTLPMENTIAPFPLYSVHVSYRFPRTKLLFFTKKDIAFVVYPDPEQETARFIAVDRTIASQGEKQQSIKLIDRELSATDSDQTITPERYGLYGILLAEATRLSPQPLEIDVRSDDEIVLSFGLNRRVIVGGEAIDDQLRSLQSLLDKPTIVETMVEVDMRFAHPILRKQVFVPWHDKQSSPLLI
jgi:hypothetical protein